MTRRTRVANIGEQRRAEQSRAEQVWPKAEEGKRASPCRLGQVWKTIADPGRSWIAVVQTTLQTAVRREHVGETWCTKHEREQDADLGLAAEAQDVPAVVVLIRRRTSKASGKHSVD
ncbi:hypothetical protein PG997_004114 [Apiospora hydei]|uniref:Transposase n=1 Tax=Apiospora hydei TaxID=1337664 RepID=A0ABR1X158_9PEZI